MRGLWANLCIFAVLTSAAVTFLPLSTLQPIVVQSNANQEPILVDFGYQGDTVTVGTEWAVWAVVDRCTSCNVLLQFTPHTNPGYSWNGGYRASFVPPSAGGNTFNRTTANWARDIPNGVYDISVVVQDPATSLCGIYTTARLTTLLAGRYVPQVTVTGSAVPAGRYAVVDYFDINPNALAAFPGYLTVAVRATVMPNTRNLALEEAMVVCSIDGFELGASFTLRPQFTSVGNNQWWANLTSNSWSFQFTPSQSGVYRCAVTLVNDLRWAALYFPNTLLAAQGWNAAVTMSGGSVVNDSVPIQCTFTQPTLAVDVRTANQNVALFDVLNGCASTSGDVFSGGWFVMRPTGPAAVTAGANLLGRDVLRVYLGSTLEFQHNLVAANWTIVAVAVFDTAGNYAVYSNTSPPLPTDVFMEFAEDIQDIDQLNMLYAAQQGTTTTSSADVRTPAAHVAVVHIFGLVVLMTLNAIWA